MIPKRKWPCGFVSHLHRKDLCHTWKKLYSHGCPMEMYHATSPLPRFSISLASVKEQCKHSWVLQGSSSLLVFRKLFCFCLLFSPPRTCLTPQKCYITFYLPQTQVLRWWQQFPHTSINPDVKRTLTSIFLKQKRELQKEVNVSVTYLAIYYFFGLSSVTFWWSYTQVQCYI